MGNLNQVHHLQTRELLLGKFFILFFHFLSLLKKLKDYKTSPVFLSITCLVMIFLLPFSIIS